MFSLVSIRTWRHGRVFGQDPFIALVNSFITLTVLVQVTSEYYYSFLHQPVSFREVLLPLTLLICSLTVELYGASSGRQLVAHGAIIYILISAFMWLANQLPVAPSSPLSDVVFTQIFGHSWLLDCSRLIAYLTAQYTHIHLWVWLKKRLQSSYLWMAGMISLSISGLLDTLFLGAATSWSSGNMLLLGAIFSTYTLKTLIALGGLPIILFMRRAYTTTHKSLNTSPRWEASFLLLCCTFLSALLLTNIITAKYFTLGGGLVLTAGAITYPFTFSLLDIISELYGASKAKVTVGVGLAGSLLMTTMLQLMGQLPAFEGVGVSQATVQLVFGFTPGIVIGSMVAYLAAQLLDIYLFAWARRLTGTKHLWFRNNISTLISQFIDTLLFGLIAWVIWPMFTWNSSIAALPWSAWYPIIINEYAFKVIFTIMNTPLVYGGVYILQRLRYTRGK